MELQKHYIILDYDGTLHDTMHIYKNAFLEAYEELVKEKAAPPRSFTDSEISCWLGYNSKMMWDTFMPELSQAYKERASACIGAAMVRQIREGRARLYSGAVQALEELKAQGFQLLFLSNCKETYLEAHRQYFGLERFFTDFYCCQTYDFRPKSEIIPIIMKEHPGNYLAAGDRASDLEAARANSIPFIGCSYGFGSSTELECAELLAASVNDLPVCAKKLNTRAGDYDYKKPTNFGVKL